MTVKGNVFLFFFFFDFFIILIVVILVLLNTFFLYCCILVGKRADMMSEDFRDRQTIEENGNEIPEKDKEA